MQIRISQRQNKIDFISRPQWNQEDKVRGNVSETSFIQSHDELLTHLKTPWTTFKKNKKNPACVYVYRSIKKKHKLRLLNEIMVPRWLNIKNHLQYRRHGFNSTPGSGRSPGGGHGNPLQYSCLKNPMDRGAWQATVHGVSKSWTRLSN